MIMNKKDYDVLHEQPVEMEETKPYCECNIECGKTLIYNNAYFFNIIKNYPDASNIIREMIYFGSHSSTRWDTSCCMERKTFSWKI